MNPTFGVTNDTKSNNLVPFPPKFTKAVLIDVKTEEIGKQAKYRVLTFTFKDIENIKTHRHTEWVVKPDDANFDKKMSGMNVRIKHIHEAFHPFPATGLGTEAKSWDEFFEMVVKGFNEGRGGKKIYTHETGEGEQAKEVPSLVWVKLGYDNKGDISFPLSPNFIENISQANANQPKKLTWNIKYDRDQPAQPKANPDGNIMGGGGVNDFTSNTNTDDMF